MTAKSCPPAYRRTEVARQPQNRFATVADRPAPTVGDGGAMTLVDGGEAQPAASQTATMPTLVVSDAELAARKAAHPGAPPQAIPRAHLDVPIAKRRSPLLLIGALAIVLLILVGAGVFALMKLQGDEHRRDHSFGWFRFARADARSRPLLDRSQHGKLK